MPGTADFNPCWEPFARRFGSIDLGRMGADLEREDALVAQFHPEMESIFERERELGLCSTRLIKGVRRYGGVGYARRLLEKAESDLPENTFTFLTKQGRLDLTMECHTTLPRDAPPHDWGLALLMAAGVINLLAL